VSLACVTDWHGVLGPQGDAAAELNWRKGEGKAPLYNTTKGNTAQQ